MTDQTPNDTNPTDEPAEADRRYAPPPEGLPDLRPDDAAPLTVDPDELDALADELDEIVPAASARPTYTDVDVDSALDAVSGLADMFEQQEAAEAAVAAQQQAEQQVVRDEEARLDDILANPMPRPTPLRLRRGSPASVLTGLTLVGVGGWLTFATTTGTPPPTTTVAAALFGTLAALLLIAWAGGGRWNRGTLFIALWGLFSAGGVYAAGELLEAGVVAALVTALGAAFFLSGLFARPVSGGALLVGLMALVAGGVALAYALDQIPAAVLTAIGAGWAGVALVVALVILLPLIRRARG